jgi:hypothetical protein
MRNCPNKIRTLGMVIQITAYRLTMKNLIQPKKPIP